MKIYGPKLRCLKDHTQIMMRGNYDSSTASNLMVVFELCDPEADETLKCKSEIEIEEWMRQKYLIVYINEKRFIQHKFDEERIKKHSIFNWYPLT